MKSLLLLMLSLSISFSLFAQRVVLKIGKGDKKSEYNFYYTDEVAMGHPHFDIKGTEEIAIDRPVLLIEAENSQNCYLVNPGDTLLFTKIKGAAVTTVVRTNRKYTKAQNDEFLFFARLIKDVGAMRFPLRCPPEFKTAMSKQEREQKISAMYQQRLKYLKDYGIKYQVSIEFIQYCKSLFSGILVQDILSLCRESETISPLSVKDYSAEVDRLKKKLVPFLPAINNIEYQKALISLSYLLTSSIDEKKYPEVRTLIDGHFNAGDKEFLLAYRLIKLIKEGKISASTAGQYVAAYNNSFPQSNYKAKLSEYYQNGISVRNASTNTNTVLINNSGSKSTWSKLIAENKGKVIYVDFWASWCAPCKAEMPASQMLRKHYDHMAVTFVYLSLDEKRADWKNSATSLKLPEGTSYLVEGDFEAKLARDLKIKSIPRYLLINKSGQIILPDAPRPGESRLKLEIEQLLKQ